MVSGGNNYRGPYQMSEKLHPIHTPSRRRWPEEIRDESHRRPERPSPLNSVTYLGSTKVCEKFLVGEV